MGGMRPVSSEGLGGEGGWSGGVMLRSLMIGGGCRGEKKVESKEARVTLWVSVAGERAPDDEGESRGSVWPAGSDRWIVCRCSQYVCCRRDCSFYLEISKSGATAWERSMPSKAVVGRQLRVLTTARVTTKQLALVADTCQRARSATVS
jgi:hypothetical protein